MSEPRRSPRGERGLKSQPAGSSHGYWSRSPRGERGLKFGYYVADGCPAKSLPAWGAWIEIIPSTNAHVGYWVAPRVGSVD